MTQVLPSTPPAVDPRSPGQYQPTGWVLIETGRGKRDALVTGAPIYRAFATADAAAKRMTCHWRTVEAAPVFIDFDALQLLRKPHLIGADA